MTTSSELDPDIDRRLDRLSQQTGRSKAFHLQQSIAVDLDKLEDHCAAFATAERVRSGEERVYALDDLTAYHTANRTDVLEKLRESKPTLAARYGVATLALFGSASRDTAGPGSDIDVLVSFDGLATSERYFGVQFFLEDLLSRPVDLVTVNALRPELRQAVEAEAVHV